MIKRELSHATSSDSPPDPTRLIKHCDVQPVIRKRTGSSDSAYPGPHDSNRGKLGCDGSINDSLVLVDIETSFVLFART
jgi:hypothetical protein